MEKSFMNTELYQLINNYVGMRRINQLATVDGDLDGTYCSRYNSAVHEYGIPNYAKGYKGLNSRCKEVENHLDQELNDPFSGINHLIGQ
jgi:hypothetical protein